MTERTWLEVEMDESMDLLRKIVDRINDEDPEDVHSEDICDLEKVYKTIYYIMSIKKSLDK